jgi:hypothetical protein
MEGQIYRHADAFTATVRPTSHWHRHCPVPAAMENVLLEVARQKLRAGDLPCGHHKTWGGRGAGYPCALCGEVITPQGIEYEVEHRNPPRMQRFHARCFWVWEHARAEEC